MEQQSTISGNYFAETKKIESEFKILFRRAGFEIRELCTNLNFEFTPNGNVKLLYRDNDASTEGPDQVTFNYEYFGTYKINNYLTEGKTAEISLNFTKRINSDANEETKELNTCLKINFLNKEFVFTDEGLIENFSQIPWKPYLNKPEEKTTWKF